MNKRGRPSLQPRTLKKYIQTFSEVPTKPELGWVMTWYYDLDKSPNSPYKTKTVYPKNYIFPKPSIEKNKPYGKFPVVLVYKTSTRSNAKTKIRIYKTKNIDWILSQLGNNKLLGFPKNGKVLDLGIGESFIEKYKKKYNL